MSSMKCIIDPPSVPELFYALRIAGAAYDVVRQIIEKGRPDADDFIDLCHQFENLESVLIPGPEGLPEAFYRRSEELYDLEPFDDGPRVPYPRKKSRIPDEESSQKTQS